MVGGVIPLARRVAAGHDAARAAVRRLWADRIHSDDKAPQHPKSALQEWAAANRPRFIGEAQAAVGARLADHIQKKGTENIRPEILAAMGLDKKSEAAE